MSIEVLKSLQSPILHKLESASLTNLADVLFAYSTASSDMLSVAQGELAEGEVSFVNKLQKAVNDKVLLLEYCNTLSSTKLQWALARYQSRKIAPNYHLDVSNAILSRQEMSKVSSVSHAIYKDIVKQILTKRKVLTP